MKISLSLSALWTQLHCEVMTLEIVWFVRYGHGRTRNRLRYSGGLDTVEDVLQYVCSWYDLVVLD